MELVPVDDPSDPRIAVFLGLRDKALRQQREAPGGDLDGVFIAEGDVVIGRAIAAGYELRSVLIDASRRQPLPPSFEGTTVFEASSAVLQEIAGFGSYRGALACFARRGVPDAATLLGDDSLRTIAVVEGVNNPTNLGVILRCAAGMDVDALLLAPGTCDPLSRRCCRVSMGEGFAVPYSWLPPMPAAVEVVRAAGFDVWALTPGDGATPIGSLRVPAEERVAVLLGAEGPGLSAEALTAADRRVAIPMSGSVDSINVGAAAAVAFYAVAQARQDSASMR